MTRRRSRPRSDGLPAPVTGVASGSQGTGTALDDTQVYDSAELASIARAAIEVQVEDDGQPEPAPRPRAPRTRSIMAPRIPRVAIAAGLVGLLGGGLVGFALVVAPDRGQAVTPTLPELSVAPFETPTATDGGGKGKGKRGNGGRDD
jgi:hypothetical protein